MDDELDDEDAEIMKFVEDVKNELDDEDAEIMKFVEAEVIVAVLVKEVLIKSLVRMVLGPSSSKLDIPWLILII